jgi:ABC-type uncharacterized transport system substrate-binding protein
VFRLHVLLVVLCWFVGWSVPAAAHPHVWIVARSEIMFDAEGKLTGFRHTWTFDPAYSTFAVAGLDSHGDGKPDPDKLADLAKTNVESLEEWGYFTAAKVNGAQAKFAPPTDYSQTYDDHRLTLRFSLPLRTAVRAPKVIALDVNDPSFFVAFNLAEDRDAVTLAGPARGCALNVKRPAKPTEEGVQLLADAVANALAGKLDPATLGGDYTPHILVACP